MRNAKDSLSVGEHYRHRIGFTTKQIWGHHECKVCRGHLSVVLYLFFQEQLEEANNEKYDPPVDGGKSLDDMNASIGILGMGDAFVVHLFGDQRIQ